jgi:hypothetical protein
VLAPWHIRSQNPCFSKNGCAKEPAQRFVASRVLNSDTSLLGAAVGPVYLALACLLDAPDDLWFVGSDEPTDAQTLDEYGVRFDIEESLSS